MCSIRDVALYFESGSFLSNGNWQLIEAHILLNGFALDLNTEESARVRIV